jgi:acetolactate synthase-1/2/3 large subunit
MTESRHYSSARKFRLRPLATELFMQTISGGDAVCYALKAAGVDCVFGIPSQQNLGIYDALCRQGDIRVIGARHEQGAVHAADGYARATGKLGVAIVSTGPGTANAMNGLYEAAFASSPVLLITTQIDSCYLGKGKGFIHNADQQLAMLRTVVRSAERVGRAEDIARKIHQVIADIQTGRPQPGAVEIPTDFLLQMLPHEPLIYQHPAAQAPDSAAIARAAQMLAGAKRPLVWLGGGCSAGAAAILPLIERLGAPVVSTPNGRGVVPHDHPLYVGCQTPLPAFRELLAQADAVLAIGTRFQALASQYWTLPMPALIHLDADPAVIGLNFTAAVALVGDAALGAAVLAEQLPPRSADRDFLDLAATTRERLEQNLRGMIGADHHRIADAVAAQCPADGPIVCDATVAANTWGNYLLPVQRTRVAHYSTSLAIGPALPLGIGAALGTGRKTLVIHGDGGVMLNIAELAMAVEVRAPVILCVFNDRGYGVLRDIQNQMTQRPYAVDLHTPDFVALARSFGAAALTASSADEFANALQTALAHDGPCLIEIDLKKLAPIRMFG